MKRNVKLVSLFLALVMTTGMVAGCGSKKPDAGTSSVNQTANQNNSDKRELVGNGNTYVTGLPVLEKKETFKIARGRNALDQSANTNDKPICKTMEEDTNIHIEWIDVPSGAGAEDKVSILLSTDLPDAFLGLVNSTNIMKDYDSFVPLNDMLEKYAPNIMDTYNKTSGEAIELLTYPNKNIYSLMSSVYTQYPSWTIGVQFINKKWLERVGKEIPTTLDQFYDVLKAFKEKDANGNGNPNDEIPLEFAQNNYQARLMQFMGSFGFNDNYKVKDGKILSTTDTKEYRQFLEFYHKLAKEGLIDVEGFSQTDQQYMSKTKSGICGSFYAWSPETVIDKKELSDEYVQVLPMAAPGLEGQQTVYGKINRFMGIKEGLSITSACKNPIALVRWWDHMGSSPEMKHTAHIGAEGVMWEKKDGKFYAKENQGPNFNFQGSCYTYGFMQSCPVLLFEELTSVDKEISPQVYTREGYVKAVESFIPKEGIPNKVASEEKTLEKAAYEPDLTAYIDNFTANSIMKGVTDSSWEKHLKDLKKYKYNEWIKWNQDYLDGKF